MLMALLNALPKGSILTSMKKIFYLLGAIGCIGCYNVERNCNDFHTGTFQFQQIIGDQLQTSTFLRTESLEVEYFNTKVDSASIRWINDCECVL